MDGVGFVQSPKHLRQLPSLVRCNTLPWSAAGGSKERCRNVQHIIHGQSVNAASDKDQMEILHDKYFCEKYNNSTINCQHQFLTGLWGLHKNQCRPVRPSNVCSTEKLHPKFALYVADSWYGLDIQSPFIQEIHARLLFPFTLTFRLQLSQLWNKRTNTAMTNELT